MFAILHHFQQHPLSSYPSSRESGQVGFPHSVIYRNGTGNRKRYDVAVQAQRHRTHRATFRQQVFGHRYMPLHRLLLRPPPLILDVHHTPLRFQRYPLVRQRLTDVLNRAVRDRLMRILNVTFFSFNF